MLGDNEYLKSKLIEAFQNSNDSTVKNYTIQALAYAFGEDVDVQSFLAAGYGLDSNREVREGYVIGLRQIYLRSRLEPEKSNTVLSDKSINVFVTAVADPDATISLAALDVIQFEKPVAALPDLIERLPSATDQMHIAKHLEVISLYDESKVLPYVEKLQETSSSVESDETRRAITALVQKLRDYEQ